ncbi:MAG: hypothetical protein WA777_01720 [Rhodanobacter sp.]
MAVFLAIEGKVTLAGYVNPGVSTALSQLAVDYWPPYHADVGGRYRGQKLVRVNPPASGRAFAGQPLRGYVDDYYNRIHLMPASMALGNVVTAQQRTVSVWNAWLDRGMQVNDIKLTALDSIALSGQGSLPLTMTPMQVLNWNVSIDVSGSATLSGTIDWHFDDGTISRLPVTGNRITAWSFVPNWDGGITERLEWLTLVERGSNGNETSTPLREYPRRSWEFRPLVEGAARQRLEAMLYDASSRNWAVPVFVDQSVLAADIPPGAATIPVNTSSLDFTAGGLAILHNSSLNFEVVQVDTVSSTGITVKNGTQGAWLAGTRLFPMRLARLDDWPQLDRYSSNVMGSGSVRFVSVDANDWPAQMPAAAYRSYPVLESRPEWSDNPQVQYARDVELIDSGTGIVLVDDVTGLPWPTQTHRWQLYGRADRDNFRRLIYALQGRVGYVWLPTWADDLTLTADLMGNSAQLQIKWYGYANYLHAQPGRRDIRVELADGTVIYRRITGSSELNSTVEQLGVDTPWPSTIARGNVARVSFIALCRLNSDTVEIQHITDIDGVAACAATFAQVTANG